MGSYRRGVAVKPPGTLLPGHLSGLLRPEAYPHSTEAIEVIQTNISWVLLTGSFAYKIKRPVQYAFIDLRTAERRVFFCREELRLNQRFAPELYLDVCDITLDDGAVRIGGTGLVIERAVRMKQFPRDEELDRLLAGGRIAERELESFGRRLATIHVGLPIASTEERWGRPDHVRSVVLENLDQCGQANLFGKSERVRAIYPLITARLEILTPWLSHRLAAGCVRECHGDLHARNIVRRDAQLLAFDCLEFDPAFRWIDVADEIAFLLADLRVLGYAAHAHAFLSGYLFHSGDYEACRVLDLYEAHRALVRAKVTALGYQGQDADEVNLNNARTRYDAYLERARRVLGSKEPQLLIMAGLSGSGKTWLASRLAPLLEALHLRSDIERKRVAGLAETERSGSSIEQGIYAPEARRRVYEHLARCAEHALCGGYSAIVDATFDRREHRALFRHLATRLGVNLRLISCHAAADVLRRRVAHRVARGTDASDADVAVLQWQEANVEPVLSDEGLSVVEVDTTQDEPTPSTRELAVTLGSRGAPPSVSCLA